MRRVRPEQHPSFEFEPESQPDNMLPVEKDSVGDPPRIDSETRSSSPRDRLDADDKEKLDSGDWCRECDMPLGTGNCVKCIRVRRQRGLDYPEPMKVDKPVVRKGRFQQKLTGLDLLRGVQEKIEAEVRQAQLKKIRFDKMWKKLTPSKREEYRRMSMDEKEQFQKTFFGDEELPDE